MDVEKLIRRLRNDADAYRNGETLGRAFADQEDVLDKAATALSTLQDENEKLRADLEYEREHANAYYEECGQWEAENEKLRAELEKVKAERDAAVKKYEAEKEDFLDYALSGTQNAAPFCRNRHPDCVDKRGWCIPVRCRGFSRDKED